MRYKPAVTRTVLGLFGWVPWQLPRLWTPRPSNAEKNRCRKRESDSWPGSHIAAWRLAVQPPFIVGYAPIKSLSNPIKSDHKSLSNPTKMTLQSLSNLIKSLWTINSLWKITLKSLWNPYEIPMKWPSPWTPTVPAGLLLEHRLQPGSRADLKLRVDHAHGALERKPPTGPTGNMII